MRHSPKQDLSQERLHGLGSEESFVPHCFGGNGARWSSATSKKPRRGEPSGKSESIEPSCGPTTKLPTIWHIADCPRREWSRWEASDMDKAQRVNDLTARAPLRTWSRSHPATGSSERGSTRRVQSIRSASQGRRATSSSRGLPAKLIDARPCVAGRLARSSRRSRTEDKMSSRPLSCNKRCPGATWAVAPPADSLAHLFGASSRASWCRQPQTIAETRVPTVRRPSPRRRVAQPGLSRRIGAAQTMGDAIL